jgi:hypothetical protein
MVRPAVGDLADGGGVVALRAMLAQAGIDREAVSDTIVLVAQFGRHLSAWLRRPAPEWKRA